MQRAALGMLLSSRLLLPSCGRACPRLLDNQLPSQQNSSHKKACYQQYWAPQFSSASCSAASSIASAADAAATTAGSTGQGVRLPDLQQSMAGRDGIPELTLEETLQVVKVPPNPTNPGARVEHLEVAADGQLSDVVATALQLPAWFVLELMRFGAVHYSPIMPSPAAAARHACPSSTCGAWSSSGQQAWPGMVATPHCSTQSGSCKTRPWSQGLRACACAPQALPCCAQL
ncbi:hypothetical protein COO60DRAFT_12968 [Scenedesmus sp. NREL 46B-D3]|nr:hypothetical protein COO60DRAFT_12968 [Scenedesmus sp. NREL 46B-D3]